MQTNVRRFLEGTHEVLLCAMRHRVTGVVIAAMGSAGVVGTLVTFWPY